MESNRKHFIQCFRPVLLPLFAFGCLSFRINAEQNFEISTFTKLYTNLIRLAAVGILILGCVLKINSGQYSQHVQELSLLIQLLAFTEQVAAAVEYLEVSVILDIKKRNHIELFERAYQLDKMLVEEFAVNFNYEKTIRKNAIYVTAINMYCVIYYISYYLINIDSDWRVGVMAIGYVACTLGPNTSAFAHMGAMDFFRVRFRLFQLMFKRYFTLSSTEEHAKRQHIFSLLKHYQKYCDLMQSVNYVYGSVAIATYFHDFSQCTSMVFVLCHKALESRSSIREYVLLYLFVIPRLIKMIYTVIYSRSTYNENKVCSQIIGTYYDHYPEKEIKENINAFLLWKKHNTVQFTVGTVLKLNYALIYSFFLGIGNYVLILIQLKLQEDSIAKGLRKSFIQPDLHSSASTLTSLSTIE